MLLGGILAALQRWVGINVIFNYAEEVYRSAGFGVTDTLLNIVATGVIALITNILAVPLVDRYGRRFAQQSEWCDATLSVRPQELGRLAGSRTIRFRFHCLALIKPNLYGALLCHQFQIAVCAQRTVLNLGAAGESRGATLSLYACTILASLLHHKPRAIAPACPPPENAM